MPGPAEVETDPPLVDAEAEALPLAEVLTLPELDGLALGAVEGLGVDDGVPPPAAVPVPATEPGEPAFPLMRPLAFGARLTSVLPGAVIVEPPRDGPGELLVMDPPATGAVWAAA